MRKILLLTAFIICGFNFTSKSQNAEKGKLWDKWSVNVNAGIPMLWGDVETTLSDKFNVRTGFGVYLAKQISPVFELRGDFTKGSLAGSKPQSNQYFDADFYKYHLNLTMSFTRLLYKNDPCKRLNIYGIAGIGFTQYRSLLKKISDNTVIGNAAYKSVIGSGEEWETEAIIPLGLGISYKIDRRFEINGENQWYIVNSDRVDAAVGGFKYDILSYTSIGITYKFNFRNNPSTFAECGDYTNSKSKKGSLGDAAHFDDGSKAEKDSLNAKLKDLEDKMNSQDAKVKDLENKVKVLENQPKLSTPEGNLNIEALKRDIYKSILDTLKKSNPTIISSGYLQFSVFFDVNKFNIKDEEMKKVASIAEYMKNDKNLRIKVVGNADQSGSDDYNDFLSKKRAEQVFNTLINKYGIDKSRLSLDSKGKRDPFSKEHFSVNRRVDFIKE